MIVNINKLNTIQARLDELERQLKRHRWVETDIQAEIVKLTEELEFIGLQEVLPVPVVNITYRKHFLEGDYKGENPVVSTPVSLASLQLLIRRGINTWEPNMIPEDLVTLIRDITQEDIYKHKITSP